MRARDFLYQVDRKRSLSSPVILSGAYLCIRGFFFKLVVADNISPIVDQQWKALSSASSNPSDILAVIFLFSMQIFADFAGYTDIARGVAYLLGFRLPINFKYPYLASSFSDFWQRWHISLSSWLRDYLYVPLGGNRISAFRTYVNLLVVMLLGGLWHGAAYTFVIWGAIHGVALVLERAAGLSQRRWFLFGFLWWLVVQATILMAWTFFRATSAQEAISIIGQLVSTQYASSLKPDVALGLLFALPVLAVHGRAWLVEQRLVPRAGQAESAGWAAVMCYLTLTWYGRSVSPFIYFQF